MNEIQPPLRPNVPELLDTKTMKEVENSGTDCAGDNFLLDNVAITSNHCRSDLAQISNNSFNNNSENEHEKVRTLMVIIVVSLNTCFKKTLNRSEFPSLTTIYSLSLSLSHSK